MWIGLAVLLVATVFVRNLYCRFLCPVGATLGIISQPDRLPDQALVRVQDLQDLREDLRVGRHPGAEDRRCPSACAATTASGSTWTSRSARTGSSSPAPVTGKHCFGVARPAPEGRLRPCG